MSMNRRLFMEKGQLICDFSIELSDTPSPSHHWLLIFPRGKVEPSSLLRDIEGHTLELVVPVSSSFQNILFQHSQWSIPLKKSWLPHCIIIIAPMGMSHQTDQSYSLQGSQLGKNASIWYSLLLVAVKKIIVCIWKELIVTNNDGNFFSK